MPRRAFIVAIERYDAVVSGLAPQLPGTHASARAFRDWLAQERGVDPADIFFCTEDEALEGRTAGATRAEIVAELGRLHDVGKDTTEELYCYLSGHGFCYTDIDGARLTDVLVGADFRTLAASGDACLRVDELQKWLKLCLGPAHHFYFLDCCRNAVSEREIKVAVLGLTYQRSALGDPTVYTLLSTTEGRAAAVESGFASALIDALKGEGRAKVWWRGNAMAVLFGSVTTYIKARLPNQPVDERKEGSGEGLIVELAPPPRFTCKVVVDGARTSDRFDVRVVNSRGDQVAAAPFEGGTWRDQRVPDDYLISVSEGARELPCLDPLPVDLYQDATVRFSLEAPVAAAPGGEANGDEEPEPPTAVGHLRVVAPDYGSVELRGAGGEDALAGAAELSEDLPPGQYTLDVLDRRDVRVGRRHVAIAAGESNTIHLAELRSSPLRDALLASIPGQHGGGNVDFSETLGPTPDQGLDLWLAVIGAARIVRRDPTEFSKLGPLPLASFDDAPSGATGFYLLAGFEDPETRFAAAFDDRRVPEPAQVPTHPSFPGLHELVVGDAGPGSRLLAVQVGESTPVVLPVCALPSRITLVTLTLGQDGGLRIQQLLLPIGHLAHEVPISPPEPGMAPVRRIVEIQREFASGRDLADVLTVSELGKLLDVKWFEPVTAILAAYELARRGRGDQLGTAVRNLRAFFSEVPDVEAIARLAGDPHSAAPAAPPLVLEGLLALDLEELELPLPQERLDFRGPWTMWRGG